MTIEFFFAEVLLAEVLSFTVEHPFRTRTTTFSRLLTKLIPVQSPSALPKAVTKSNQL